VGIGISPGPFDLWQMFFDFTDGDKIVISNGYTNEFKGEVSLTKGKFGKMDINP